MSSTPLRDRPHLVASPVPVGWILVVWVVAMTTATLVVGYDRIVLDLHPTQLFDWLISYDGGFVRRGLSGSALAFAARVTGVPLPVVAYGLHATLYVGFAAGVLVLLRGVSVTWSLAVPLFAPFLFPFPVMAANAGYRKDILALAVLAIICAVFVNVAMHRRAAVVLGGLAAWLPIVLIHEALALVALFLAPLAVGATWTRRQAVAAATLVVAIGAAVLAAVMANGDTTHVEAVCASLRMRLAMPLESCGAEHTALYWLGADPSTGAALVRDSLDRLVPGIVAVAPLTALGMAPAVWETLRLAPRREGRALLVAIALAVLGSLPLFVVAVDWGRFVYLPAGATTVLLLAVRHGRPTPPRTPWWPALFFVPYALLWSLGPNGVLFRGGWWQRWL